jgi:hypothetical protein
MMRDTHVNAWRTIVTLACAVALTSGEAAVSASSAAAAGTDNDKRKKPSVSVRTSPQSGFSPLRVVATAELRGGPDDYEAFYCPVIEWEWGDGTRTEQRVDCDPYEAGTSEVKRRYTVERLFHSAGDYKVVFRMKQNNKVVGSGQTLLRIRPGVRDPGFPDWHDR